MAALSQHPLATESFSYSWLIQPNHPNNFDSGFDFDYDFDFDLTPSGLADADDIFSDGHLLPLYYKKPNTTATPLLVHESKRDSSSASPVRVHESRKGNGRWVWKKSSNKVVQQMLKVFLRCCRRSSRVDDLERKASEVAAAEDDHHPSASVSATENSIHEAILYCKRSNSRCR